MRIAIGFLVLGLALLAASTPAHGDSPDDILVIANKDVGVGAISVDDLRDIFLKKKATWSGGQKAIPVNAMDGSRIRNLFRKRVIGMNPAEEQTYWQQFQIKTGEPQPSSFGNTLKAVFSLHGSVSYVFRSQFKEGVAKVLLVLPAG